jgi:hypothetical protein
MAEEEFRESAVSKSFGFLHRVTYGGVVGKKTAIACVALIVLATLGVTAIWGNIWIVLVILLVLVFVVIYSNHSIDGTLSKHPHYALLDGGEIVRIHEIQSAAKGIRVSPQAPLIAKETSLALPEPNQHPEDSERGERA